VDTFVGYWLEPYSKGTRKRLLTSPRFYLFDTGVRNAAARLPIHADLLKSQGGSLFEQWVGLELIHRARYAGAGHRVGFWRTVGGAEVDFIYESPEEVLPIECKWTQNPTPTDARHVEGFIEDHPSLPCRRGFVVCRVSEPRQITPRVKAIPWDHL